MAKILKDGEYPEENKIICEECKCEFQYYNSEVKTDITTPDEQDFLGGFGVHKYINCPCCNYVCTISCEFEKNKSIKEWLHGRFNKSK